MNIDPYAIINNHYRGFEKARDILIEHSEAVATKAIKIARRQGLSDDEIQFIKEASLLHDIGMYLCNAPSIGCYGKAPYICHGFMGHDLLATEGWPIHALVCERHTGTGLSLEDIRQQNLPIPMRPMEPLSLPEKIITYADKFFSKNPGKLGQEQDVNTVRAKLLKHGKEKLAIFDGWHKIFGWNEAATSI